MNSFNLLERPWIPVRCKDGTEQEVSLQDALTSSHEFVSIVHRSPLVRVAIHRLLLAVLHRNFGPAGTHEWVALWKTGQWDRSKLSSYFSRWHDRFDLFDRERPFYQASEMEDAVVHPAEHLVQEAATGNNPTLFDHSYEERPRPLSPADAAAYLLAQQCYAIGFGKSSPFYFSDAPLVRGMTVLLFGRAGDGESLFQTLALNLKRYSGGEDDLPAWEVDTPPEPRQEGTVPAGYLDYLTWQSRRINLIAEDGLVVGCRIQQNLKMVGDFDDPFKAYRVDEKRGRVPISLSAEKAVWRHADALFMSPRTSQKSSTERPAVFNWAVEVRDRARAQGYSLDRCRFGAYGLATDPGKAASVVLWRQETLPLPLAILDDPNLSEKVGAALRAAEEVGTVLYYAARDLGAAMLAPEEENGGREAHPDDRAGLVRHFGLERTYWAALGRAFSGFLSGLPENPEGASGLWLGDVERAAKAAFRSYAIAAGTSARALKAVVRAERTFGIGLARVTRKWKGEAVGGQA